MNVALESLSLRRIGVYQRRRSSLPLRCTRVIPTAGTKLLEKSPPANVDTTLRPTEHYVEKLHLFPACYELNPVQEQLTSEERTESKDQPPDDYYANFGKAIETIKHDFPRLFQQDFDYSIYRDDLVFRDPINSFQGKKFYRYMLLSLRWHGRVFFKRVYVRIHNLHPRQEGSIRVRWSVHGRPRIPWEAEGVFDGVSEYQLDRHGKIYEHSVDNIIFRDPPVFNLPVLFARFSTPHCARTPIPSMYCKTKTTNETSVLIHHFSWVRLYLALSVAMSVLHNHRQKSMNLAY